MNEPYLPCYVLPLAATERKKTRGEPRNAHAQLELTKSQGLAIKSPNVYSGVAMSLETACQEYVRLHMTVQIIKLNHNCIAFPLQVDGGCKNGDILLVTFAEELESGSINDAASLLLHHRFSVRFITCITLYSFETNLSEVSRQSHDP